MKFVDFTGLKTLSAYLKQTMLMAGENSSAISGLTDDVQGISGHLTATLKEVENCLNELETAKANIAIRQEFTLAASGWVEDKATPDYPFKYVFVVEGITPADRVDAVLTTASMDTASSCKLSPTTETVNGGVIFRSCVAPGNDISGQLYITQDVDSSNAAQNSKEV